MVGEKIGSNKGLGSPKRCMTNLILYYLVVLPPANMKQDAKLSTGYYWFWLTAINYKRLLIYYDYYALKHRNFSFAPLTNQPCRILNNQPNSTGLFKY